MQTIKRKISLEPLINREYPIIRSGINSSIDTVNGCPIQPIPIGAEEYVGENVKYGKIDKSFIYIPIHFTQTFDNIGLFTDEEFIGSDELINSEPDVFIRQSGVNIENYFTFEQYLVTGVTESQVEFVQLYSQINPYAVGLNVSDIPSLEFTGVLSISDISIIYVIGGELDSNGSYKPNTGVVYETFNIPRVVRNPLTGTYSEVLLTTFKYYTMGIRDFNTSLSALIHEEKYLNVVFKPTIDNEVLIDRGTVNVCEKHLKLSEIDSVEQLGSYGQGFFNVKKS
jgi:hypothetical protein